MSISNIDKISEKLEKIKKLADDMYYAAANLGPTVGSGEKLRKTMEDYHKFIIHEYHKEEPKFKVGDYIKPVDSCLGSPRTIVEVCDSWYVTNQGTIDFEYEDNWELVKKCNITGIKSRHATGKLKECIDNQTEEGLDKARKQLEEESKAKFKVGDKVMYLNEEYVITDNKDHYILRSTRERTSVPVVHIDFGNEDYELRLVEEPVSEDLEKEIDSYFAKWLQGASDEGCFNPDSQLVSIYDCHRIARHFTTWQKEQFEKNRLKRCNSITNEQAELEQGFIDQHLDKYNCIPSYLDAIEYGMQFKEQQMIANTVDAMIGLPYENKDGGYTHIVDVLRPLPVGHNIIAIIFKEN